MTTRPSRCVAPPHCRRCSALVIATGAARPAARTTRSAAPATRATSQARARSPRSKVGRPQAARAPSRARPWPGKHVSLRDYRGKVVVVNVWGSWCPPCRAEAPMLADAARDLAKKGVVFLGINSRNPEQAGPQAFERRYEIPYDSIYDPDGQTLLAFHGTLAPNSIPSTVVIDKQGRVAASVIGKVTRTTLGRPRRRRAAQRRAPAARRDPARRGLVPGHGALRVAGRGDPGGLLAGLVSFFSPCVVPLLPGYLSYATGLSGVDLEDARRGRMVLGSFLFVLGFSFVFVALGTLSGALGDWLFRYSPQITVVLGFVDDRGRARVHRAGAVAAARHARAPGAGRRPGRGTDARCAVRPRLDALHRADAVGGADAGVPRGHGLRRARC